MADQSNEMVSRVAASLELAIRHQAETSWGRVTRHARGTISVDSEIDTAALARAAIEAVRTPSKEMGLAGSLHSSNLRDEVRPSVAREIFVAMIDAALSHDEVKG